jgi:hypothetical protein
MGWMGQRHTEKSLVKNLKEREELEGESSG